MNPDSFKLLSDYSHFGFSNWDELVDSDLNSLARNMREQNLETTAKLFLNEYHTNSELQILTETAVNDFNE